MRRLNHLTSTYIINRLMVKLDEHRNPQNPWLTKDAVELLQQLIRTSDIGVEFGSGRSTSWFLNRMKHLTSVEANENWHEKVKNANEDAIASGKLHYLLAKEISEYSAIIASFDDKSIDFCLVDGKHRDECALNMVAKIKSGGLLAVDNINRYIPCDRSKSPGSRKKHEKGASEKWNKFLLATQDWRYIWTTNGVNDTGIWINCD